MSVGARSGSNTAGVFLYFTPLTLLVFLVLPNGFLLDIATSFMLKNRLHATPEQVAQFRLCTAIPVYLSFVFGLARDLWNPFGMRDRGLLLLFGFATAAVFALLAATPLSYPGLWWGMLAVMVTFSFVAAAARGLLALVSQEQWISGRLSALWNAISSAPYSVGAFGSGYIAALLTPEQTFLFVGLLCVLIGLIGLWRPRAVFSHAYDQPAARGSTLAGDIRRLFRHRACYPAVLLVCLSQFSPGSNTPLQYYLTNDLHLPDAAYGDFQGMLITAYIPACMLYGWLCRRYSLWVLLVGATIAYLPGTVPLLFIDSQASALWMGALMGLVNGFAFAAFWDLAMRSCPPGLQGSLMMMVAGAYELSYRGGDWVGATIYTAAHSHGFLACVALAVATNLLMFPVLRLIPRNVVATADGVRNPALEQEVLAEIGEPGVV